MQRCKLLLIIALMMLSFGCSSVVKQTTDTNSGDQSKVTGVVRYHDTPLTLRSTVIIDDKVITTVNGKFNTTLNPGLHTYTVDTLLGAYAGELYHTPGGDHSIELVVPAYTGWDRSDFNNIVVNDTTHKTNRWSDNKVIKVWIEPAGTHPKVQPKHVDMAWAAFLEWEEVLGGIITFERTDSKTGADITVEFRNLGQYAGQCVRTWNSYGYLVKGEITLGIEDNKGNFLLDEMGFYRHEAGHCIGLNHSSKSQHLMYPYVGSANNQITFSEKKLTQLLYSIEIGTGYLSNGTVTVQSFQPLSHSVTFDPETGLYKEVVY